MVMTMLIVALVTVVCLVMKSRLSVENPGKFQILLEDGVTAIVGLLEEWIGPDGQRYLPLIFDARPVHPARQLRRARARA